MIYQFEYDELTDCANCPCCDNEYGCQMGVLKESFDKIPTDCPLVAISKTETTSCEWCESKTIPLFYVECVRATLDDESQLISASYCPACGRKLN